MVKKKEEEEIEINLSKFFKEVNYSYVLILVFLLLGFSLRNYHVDYPVIGYHNWKSVHYITEARNFAKEGFFKHGFFVPMRDNLIRTEYPDDGVHKDTFPTTSIIVGFFFKIFGESLVIARLVNILFSLGSVVAIYFLIKELFERQDIALITAFLTAINPLFVFFSHNIQMVNPALFFMLLGAFFYIKWLKKETPKDLYLGVFFVMMGAITKYTFAVIAFPMLFSFPYKKVIKKYKEYIKPLGISAIIAAGFPLWVFYSEYYVKKFVFGLNLSQSRLESIGLDKLIDFGVLGDSSFWQLMKSFTADNFTLLGFLFGILGALLLLYFYFTKNREKIGYKFVVGYMVGSIAYLFIMGFKLSGHNYHQFPLAPLIIFLIAYFFDVVGKNLSRLTKSENLKKLAYVLIILMFILIPFSKGKNLYQHSMESKNRMFNKQFPGLDVAGEYIKQHSQENERIFHSSGQNYGILWHADRKGYKPPTIEDFIEGEQEKNVQWVFVYGDLDGRGLAKYCVFVPESVCTETQIERSDHLRDNYRLVQAGFIAIENQLSPIYFLFRKGGSFNESQLNQMLQENQNNIIRKQYEYTNSPYEIVYVNFE